VYFAELLKRLVMPTYLSVYNNNNNTLEEARELISNSVILKRKKCNFSLLKLVRYLDVYVPSDVAVFHSSYYRLPLFWQRKRVKVITTVHDFTYERMKKGFSAIIHRWQKRRAILNSDEIVCISESTKRDLLHFFPEAKNKSIHVIYNGVSDEFYPLNERKLEVSNYILYVGARTTYKNFITLVKGMADLKDLSLIFVGGGSVSQDEKALLDEHLKGRYEHLTYVDNAKLNELYNHAFCFVYPSLYEGFGIPVIEAMRAGCPVIAASTSSIPEVAGDAAILLDEVTPFSIIQAVERMKSDQIRSDLIKRGYTNASRFNWLFTYELLNKLYLEKK
jgi:mannosyltransferase